MRIANGVYGNQSLDSSVLFFLGSDTFAGFGTGVFLVFVLVFLLIFIFFAFLILLTLIWISCVQSGESVVYPALTLRICFPGRSNFDLGFFDMNSASLSYFQLYTIHFCAQERVKLIEQLLVVVLHR